MTVAEYARAYGVELELPADVISSATPGDSLQLRGDFLRISIVPKAAGLFLRQVLYAGAQRNLRTVSRLSLLASAGGGSLCRLQDHRRRQGNLVNRSPFDAPILIRRTGNARTART